MSATKSIMTVSTLAFAAMFGGGAYLLMNINNIAKPYIEKMATQTLGVPVSLGGLEVDLKNKAATVTGLKIRNPKGFETPNALTAQTINVKLGNVSKTLVNFDAITIAGAKAYLEAKPSGTNFQAIRAQIKPKSKPAEGSEQLKVTINRFTMSQTALHPSVTLFASEDLKPVNVPTVVLKGIGEKQNGVVAEEALKQIFESLAGQFNQTSKAAGYLKGMSSDALKDMGKKQVKALTGGFEKDIKKSLNSLFE